MRRYARERAMVADAKREMRTELLKDRIKYRVLRNATPINAGILEGSTLETTFVVKGWRDLWQVLRGGIAFTVQVDASRPKPSQVAKAASDVAMQALKNLKK